MGNSEESKEFIRNARTYNNSLALASMNCNFDRELLQGHPYCFKIHGQVYHLTGTLHPPAHRVPNFNQIYIFDTERARQERNRQAEEYRLNNTILFQLHQLLERINPYVRSFKMMHEVEREERNRAAARNISPRNIYMHIRADTDLDLRRYNEARSNEVAAVFTTQDGQPPSVLKYDIVIHARAGADLGSELGAMMENGLLKIQRMNPNCEPMTYPLLFPNGERGYTNSIPHHILRGRGRDTVTVMEYYSYKFQLRSRAYPKIHVARKLFLQYAVDCYTKMEGYRLDWARNHQEDLRVELYNGLHDAIHSNGSAINGPNERLGRRFILPSSFTGSPRAMQQNFQDAMAIVRTYGRPDLFVTFTCNPNWKEIKEQLLGNQQAQDRPDLIVRVFNMKLKELITDIRDRQCFGRTVALVYTIEFQKRGLPHAHILIILDEDSKIRDQEDVDRIVRAEIPPQTGCPNLYAAVSSHMMHGPCGIDFPNCPCMRDNCCTKNFPKQFSNETRMGEDSYPIYKRPQNAARVTKQGVELDNRWVVPYNMYLLLKYNAHINVEICASIKSIKYVYKYVYKGYDAARVEIIDSNDEILSYVTGRYVGATEALWRIYSYNMDFQSHRIERLAVHLEGGQQVYFQEGAEVEALRRASTKRTTLTAWFFLNQNDPDARQLPYHQIPTRYTWNPNRANGTWVRRQRYSNVIGRMYFVSPREQERFFLRILLLHVPGATSFENLRTFQGVVHSAKLR